MLDPCENSSRKKMKLGRNPNGTRHEDATLASSSATPRVSEVTDVILSESSSDGLR
jgi:hypothetical protein